MSRHPSISVSVTGPALITMCAAVWATRSFPLSATQDARSIFLTMWGKQLERWETVVNYTVISAIDVAGGAQAPMYYEKIDLDGWPAFRLVPITEYERAVWQQAGYPPPTAETFDAMADGSDLLGMALANGGGESPGVNFLPFAGETSQVWRMAADYQENDGRADAEKNLDALAGFASRARLVGTERTESGRDALVLQADDLFDIPLEQPKDGGEFRLEKFTMWIDTEHYVPLHYRFDGQVTQGNTSRPITIEKLALDYRQVGPLYESHRQVTGLMAGMSEKERKEMEKARKSLTEYRMKLQAMADGPEKQMVLRMMGPQIERFETMVARDAMETEIRVVSIAVNEGPPSFYGTGELSIGSITFPGALTFAADLENDRGDMVAGVFFSAHAPGEAEATFSVSGLHSFFEAYADESQGMRVGPGSSGSIPIQDAQGDIRFEDGHDPVSIEGASGTISVIRWTETRTWARSKQSSRYAAAAS